MGLISRLSEYHRINNVNRIRCHFLMWAGWRMAGLLYLHHNRPCSTVPCMYTCTTTSAAGKGVHGRAARQDAR